MALSAIGAEPKILDAISRASASSGVGFDYLLAAAQRESGLDCQAKSKTSSACGLYQFVSQTWLSTLKAHGAEHGLSAYADDIERTASGQYAVKDPARQSEILALREDPVVASAMAAELTSDNAKLLSDRLGRAPSEGELYAAHVLGATGAAKLLTLAGQSPQASASIHFPEAAATNRGLFYDKGGAPVSVAALSARLTSGAAVEAPVRLAGALRPAIDYSSDMGSSASGTGGDVVLATPSALSTWHGGTSAAPLTLTPQVLAILSALHMPIDGIDDESRRRG